MTVPSQVKLPLSFDATRLAEEAATLPADAWVPHFNTAIYEGDWSGVALRSVGGKPGQLYPDPTAQGDFADTPVFAGCTELRAAVARFECPTMAVRLLRLSPGAVIKEHKDFNLGHADGEVRLHIPIATGPGVEFYLGDQPVHMEAGECWYLDLNCPHRAVNGWDRARVHLVVDCVVDSWLDDLLENATTTPGGGVQ